MRRALALLALVPFAALGTIGGCVSDPATNSDASTDGASDDGPSPDGSNPPPDAGADADAGPPLTNCDGGLVDLQTDPKNCGACFKQCTYDGGAPNVVAACSAGMCGSACDLGWGDCNKVTSDGCETAVTNIMQCGACGHVCGSKNANPQCVLENNAYLCKLNCSAGNASCDNNDTNGCETTVATDNQNCGVCGFGCGQGTCVQGLCRLTNGGEDFTSDPQQANPIAVDANDVFWTFPNAGATNPHGVMRKVSKMGGAPADLRPLSEFQANLGTSRTIALDNAYVYYLEQSYPRNFLRVAKNGQNPPEQLGILGANGANANTIALDSDGTTVATKVFSTQVLNGSGVWAGDIPNKKVIGLIEGDPGQNGGGTGLAWMGKTLYYALFAAQKIGSIDYAQMNPSPKSFWTGLNCAVYELYATPQYLFATCNASVLRFDLPNGQTMKTVASGGFQVTHLTADANYVYVIGGGSVYRFGVNETGAPLDAGHLFVNAGPLATQFRGITQDANALYLASDKDVYRAHK